jgi:hypothetical protein
VRDPQEKGEPLVGFQDLEASSELQGPDAELPGGALDSADRTGGVFG